jgi:hypothetical protein
MLIRRHRNAEHSPGSRPPDYPCFLVMTDLRHTFTSLTWGYSSPRSDDYANPQVTNVRVRAAGGACASKRPSAGGNIRGRRRADLVAQDFDLYGWRCTCCGWGDVAVAQHTARSCSAEMPRRVGCTAGFRTMASPRDSRSCASPATTPRARAKGARSRISTARTLLCL